MTKRPCDCTHAATEHYHGEGSCAKCACTWYHPKATREQIKAFREREGIRQ